MSTPDLIVQAARAEFEAHGIRKTPLDDIARRAGVTRATVYRYFASKDLLLDAVLAAEVKAHLAAVADAAHGDGPVRERIEAAITASIAQLIHQPLYRRLIDVDGEDLLPRLTIAADAVLEPVTTSIATMLQAEVDRGTLQPIDTALVAEMIVRLGFTLLTMRGGRLNPDDPRAMKAFAGQLAHWVLAGPASTRA